ncbi:hypothetical protein BH20VER1_BH20VER1_16410 [soil metagenome]
METRLLILNADPVFQDCALGIFNEMDAVETRIVRSISEAVFVLLSENFDGFVIEGAAELALEQATSARQHFPSLKIVCLAPAPHSDAFLGGTEQQKILRIATGGSERQLRRNLHRFVQAGEPRLRDPLGGDRPVPFVDRELESVFRGGNFADELPRSAEPAVHVQVGAREQ